MEWGGRPENEVVGNSGKVCGIGRTNGKIVVGKMMGVWSLRVGNRYVIIGAAGKYRMI